MVEIKRHWLSENFLLLPLILHEWFRISLSYTDRGKVVKNSVWFAEFWWEWSRPPQHAIRPVSQRKLIHPLLKLDRSLLAFRQEYKVISFKRDRSIGLQIPYIHQDHSLSWSQFERIWLLRYLPLNDQWNSIFFESECGVIPEFYRLLKEFWPRKTLGFYSFHRGIEGKW